MLVSYNWLKDYVDLPDSLTGEELGLKLTMSTVEVEGVESQAKAMDDMVVGLVSKCKKHPNADKLKLCEVDDGTEKIQVVCGGSNVKKGIKVAFAPVGSKVRWHGEGDLVTLSKAKIRGEESFGMICAASEIGVGGMYPSEKETEILDLTDLSDKPGTLLAKALGLDDTILDIDNKSMTHRPDLWGHYGMAREVAAAYHKKLNDYKPPVIKPGKAVKLEVSVEDKDLCPRYMAVAIEGVKVEASPEWLQKRLIAVGMKPINNIVDITNYILFDLGQPMHAFDATQIEGSKIIVRKAGDGEKFTTLDDKEHKLDSSMLVIATEKKAVALAGVMGGKNSEISNKTTTIIFESANFNAVNVRRSATKLGLRTDSSARFEKSLDPNNAELALRRAVELTLGMCSGAKVVSNIVDEKNFHLYQGPIELPLEFLNKKMGIDLEKKEAIKILESLGFEVKDKKDLLLVTIPTWRATKDIAIPEDLVEEVARVYGYDNFETTLPKFSIAPPVRNELRLLERKAKGLLALECGYIESYNYSFVSPELLKKMGSDLEKYIELDNPIAKDRPYLRRNIVPNLLENIKKNAHADKIKLFEAGKVFRAEEPGQRMTAQGSGLLPRQDTYLALVATSKGDTTPYYEVADGVENILSEIGVDFKLEPAGEVDPSLHPSRTALITISGEDVGYISEVAPDVQKKLDLEHAVGVAEINLNRLLEYTKDKCGYTKLSAYPAVKRDIAFVVSSGVFHSEVVEKIKAVDELITNVELFDVYEGSNIEGGKKSMAYHITYQSNEKTLQATVVDKIHIKVKKVLSIEFGAETRK